MNHQKVRIKINCYLVVKSPSKWEGPDMTTGLKAREINSAGVAKKPNRARLSGTKWKINSFYMI